MLSSSAVRPFARASPTSVDLPKLRVPLEAGRPQQDTRLGYDNTRSGYHVAPPVPVKTEGPSGATMPSPHGPDTRSPSSPSSFFTQPEIAKVCRPLLPIALLVIYPKPHLGGRDNHVQTCRCAVRQLHDGCILLNTTLHHACDGWLPARDLGDAQASPHWIGRRSRHAGFVQSTRPHAAPDYDLPVVHPSPTAAGIPPTARCPYVPATETQSPGTAGSNSPGSRGLSTYSGASVWETVLASGKFPMDIGLSENGSTGGASPTAPFNPNNIRSASEDAADTIGIDATVELKQGRWSDDEKEYANALIQAVQRGEPTSNATTTKKKPAQRVLKRSDYSQHGMVRSGRWSVEEENYAKAMIEAFKAGYLPLHGNVSLRKFLSEVLVCHPMRISKKFVGYVRKYHWYRIAAGKCDPEAKRQALYQLSHLERVFWASLQQNSDWSAGLRRDD
ncbi:hypothetical protein GQ600_8079 [Phytophthora cactorum]|nr:hypothetical protein GQ600_8079 [Phytophthora cactorum]